MYPLLNVYRGILTIESERVHLEMLPNKRVQWIFPISPNTYNQHAYNIHVHNNRNVHNEHSYMFIIIQLFTIKINIFVRIAFGTLKNLLQQNVHWPCSVPNKLMYHGNFSLEHGHVRTRLLGTPE